MPCTGIQSFSGRTAVGGMSVSNSSFLGPIDLQFNPQYSVLIGGRGTGKSTILEYLRWALCDQPPGLEGDEAPNYQERRRRLIEQTLKPVDATIEAWFEVNDVPHTVLRESQNGTLLMKIGNDEMRPCTEEEVCRLLPIQAYSQKQLSDVSVNVEELSRFITALYLRPAKLVQPVGARHLVPPSVREFPDQAFGKFPRFESSPHRARTDRVETLPGPHKKEMSTPRGEPDQDRRRQSAAATG